MPCLRRLLASSRRRGAQQHRIFRRASADGPRMMRLPLTGCRIGLLTASASRLGGGVFEAVATQARIIRELGGEAVVFAISDEHTEADRPRFAPSQLVACERRGPRQIGFGPALIDSLLRADLDCLHQHGLWMYPSRAGAVWAKRTSRPYVISPHGMLSSWITERGRLKKAAARIAYERDSWRRASFFHALTAREAEDVRRESGRNDSLVIPNAGPTAMPNGQTRRDPHLLYIGRIHPQKNLLSLVRAWSMLAPKGDARLTIAGWGDDAAVKALRAEIDHASPSAEFVGPVFGEAKQRLLESARFTVLPSLCEGLPMFALEGWAAGVPAIMSGECNIPDAYAAGAALDSGVTVDRIAAAMERALGLSDDEWQAMSDASLGLASGPFSASTVTARWGQTYRRLLDAAER